MNEQLKPEEQLVRKDIVARVELFRDVEPHHLDSICEIARTVIFRAGEYILRENEAGDEIFILISGKVQISQNLVLRSDDDFTDKDKTLIVLDDDSLPVFGEMSLLESSPRTASVLALNDCTLFSINRADFDLMCSVEPAVGVVVLRNLARLISSRLRKANRDVLKLTTALSIVLKK